MYNPNATPSWQSVMVTRHLTEELRGLETLCKNLWWCWNDSAKALFKSIDADLWHKSGHNPMVILLEPNRSGCSLLIRSHAHIMAEARSYCCAVSNLSV